MWPTRDATWVPPGAIFHGLSGTLREVEPGDLFVALPFVDGDTHSHVEDALGAGASFALVGEGWPGLGALPAALRQRCVVVEDVLSAFRGIAAAFRKGMPYPVAAVAGSNGKTTTKEMLAALLSGPGRRVVKTPGTDNGFIGLPRTLCSRAHKRSAPPHAVVLEIGIDEIGAMAEHARMIAPDVAVVTALGPEHLDGLGDVETAVAEELRLFEEAPGARRVVPWSDPEIRKREALLREGDVAVIEEGALSSQDVEWPRAGAALVFRAALSGESSRVELAWCPGGPRTSPAWEGSLNVPMPGPHNARNAALAVAAALVMGRAPEELAAGWATFEPPPWRSRIKELGRGALLYDDCFNASPLSVEAALAALACPRWAGRPKVAVLGDMLDLGAEPSRWHDALRGPLLAIEGLRLFLFGPQMCALGGRLCDAGHAAMVRGQLAEGDPLDLVAEMEVLSGSIVLVKGSRGMRMERVVRYLELRWSADPAGAEREVARSVHSVFVAGSQGTLAATRMVGRALQCFGPGAGCLDREGAFIDGAKVAVPPGVPGILELWRRCVSAGGSYAVVELSHEQVLAAAAAYSFEIGVFTGLSEADLPPGGDVERHLAEKAQLFAGRRGLRAAVLNGDDPASELIAEVLPPGVRVLRYGTAGAALGPVDLLAGPIEISERGARAALTGAPELPDVIELHERDVESLRGKMAALLTLVALGASPRRAAAHLC